MAKKKAPKRETPKRQPCEDNSLPQNIVAFGEKVEENKNIYISQSAYKVIHRFTKGKTVNESGGMLIGSVVQAFGKTNILITGFVEAKFCEATPTTLKFTHETWEYCHKEIARKYTGQKIVGWIHTHPNFGIFLSEYDKFIQENFFKEEYEVAYVVDPIQQIEGFYFWSNGKIERCKGFYVFDKIGAKIDLDAGAEVTERDVPSQKPFAISNIVIAVLVAAVVLLAVSVVRLNNQVSTLQEQQKMLVSSANQSLATLAQQLSDLQAKVDAILLEQNEALQGQETVQSEDAAPISDNRILP